MFIIMLQEEKNNLGIYFRPIKISPKDKQNPSNSMTQTNRFLTEMIKIIFKNLKCVSVTVFNFFLTHQPIFKGK